MSWIHLLAFTLWLVAAVTLVVVPIEYKRQAGYGEAADEVVADVIAHGEGVLANAGDEALQVGIQVAYSDAAGVSHERWLYGMRQVPPVGEELSLVHPPGRPEVAGPPISAATRWRSALGLIAASVSCALLGGLLWAGASPNAAPWMRWAPTLLLSVFLAATGVSTFRLARAEAAMVDARYARAIGEVVANEPCGTRSLGGGRSMPLYCAVLRYEAAGQILHTRTVGMLAPTTTGTEWTVRYSTSRPDLALVERDRSFQTMAAAGAVMALIGLLGACAATWAWFFRAMP